MNPTIGGAMIDVTMVEIDEMEPIYHGLARRARAELGVTSQSS